MRTYLAVSYTHLYLPIHLSIPMAAGGLVRFFIEKRKGLDEKRRKDALDGGVLYSSGLIAGEGLVGILLAVLAIIPLPAKYGVKNVAEFLGAYTSHLFSENTAKLVGLGAFALLIVSLLGFSLWRKQERNKKERQG